MKQLVLTPGEAMEAKMLYDKKNGLEGTWRTWTKTEPFSLITEKKEPGWAPNYTKLFSGGQGRPYPKVRNLVGGVRQEEEDA